MIIKLDAPESQDTSQKPIDENIRVHTSQSGHLQINVADINAAVMNSTHDYCEARPGIRKPQFKFAKKI